MLLKTKRLILNKVLISALISMSVFADSEFSSVYVDEIINVYDGDTFRVDIYSYPPILGKNISIRVNGIDTPEIRGSCENEKSLAKKAKNHTKNALMKAKKIQLTNIQRGKYFRIVADVMLDGTSLGDELISKKLAVAYFGGKKSWDWCQRLY